MERAAEIGQKEAYYSMFHEMTTNRPRSDLTLIDKFYRKSLSRDVTKNNSLLPTPPYYYSST